MLFPFKWIREEKWRSESGQVIVLEMNPQHVRPAVSVQPAWNRCKGIIRGVKEIDFLVEDFIDEEIQDGKPVGIRRRLVGADEMRKQVWTIDQHKAAFARTHLDQNILGWVGNGNLLSNPHFVGFSEGTVFHLKSEAANFPSRDYSSLIVRRTDRNSVAIESIRYNQSPNGTRILTVEGKDITEEVEYATFGQQLVQSGRTIDTSKLKEMAVSGQFYDLRHLFLFGRLQIGKERWLDAGLATFWEESHLNTTALKAAIDGEPVTVDVQQFDAGAIRSAMDSKGYDEIAEPNRPGQFSLRDGNLRVVLLDGIYPHNMIGIREDGFVISVVLRGLSNRLGVSICGAAEIMCGLGAKDALLLDNGGDVMMEFGNVKILASAEGERNLLKSVLFFTGLTELPNLRPQDFRMVPYQKQYLG
jgi:hypothetical protein